MMDLLLYSFYGKVKHQQENTPMNRWLKNDFYSVIDTICMAKRYTYQVEWYFLKTNTEVFF